MDVMYNSRVWLGPTLDTMTTWCDYSQVGTQMPGSGEVETRITHKLERVPE